MKVKVGELEGKPIVVTNAVDTVMEYEILKEDTPDGVVLKYRNDNGDLVSMTPVIPENPNYDVAFDPESSVIGSSKWAKNNVYLFYAATGDVITVKNTTGDDITSHCVTVEAGTTNTVYSISKEYGSDITITCTTPPVPPTPEDEDGENGDGENNGVTPE